MYFDISNSKTKQCLTIDTRDVNFLGPGRFRTNADNGGKQVCYYNRNKTDTSFNSFLATREQTFQENDIKFSTVWLIDNINKSRASYSEVTNKLNSFNNDFAWGAVQPISGGSLASRGNSAKSKRKYDDRRNSKKPRFLSMK